MLTWLRVCIASMAVALLGCGSPSAAVLPTVSANGEASKPSVQILRDAVDTLISLQSCRFTTSELPTKAFNFDLIVGGRDKAKGTIASQGVSADLVYVNSTLYLKGQEFLQQFYSTQVAILVGNNWGKLPSNDKLAASLDLIIDRATNPRLLASCIFDEHGTLTTSRIESYSGQPAITILDKGDKSGSTPARFYIAANGPPYILRVEATGPKTPGGTNVACGDYVDASYSLESKGITLTYSDFNKTVVIEQPADAIDVTTSLNT